MSFDIIAELVRMREEAAARLLFILDLRSKHYFISQLITNSMQRIKEFFDNSEELESIYKYVYPHFDVPKI